MSASLRGLFDRIVRTPSVEREMVVERECTVCESRFDTDRSTCPACGSELYRQTETAPNALVVMLFVMGIAGLESVYNVLTGQYPKEGPGA